jgi:ectoine hydroxylase-related dioxygenase (phytanoyl-CoA dioxygenase family)
LKKGDGLFFNPALFHAAGENRREDSNRSANLLQISACWGKPMESVDRRKIMDLIWPVLRGGASEELGEKRVEALLKAVADGYSFPTNLGMDPPPNGGVSLNLFMGVRELMSCSTVRRHNSTWPL